MESRGERMKKLSRLTITILKPAHVQSIDSKSDKCPASRQIKHRTKVDAPEKSLLRKSRPQAVGLFEKGNSFICWPKYQGSTFYESIKVNAIILYGETDHVAFSEVFCYDLRVYPETGGFYRF